MLDIKDIKIGVIGLGYVGLPLAVEFGKKYPVVGFELHKKRLEELHNGYDSRKETEPEELKAAALLSFSCNENDLKSCNVYIIAVPTPIDRYKKPDLYFLISASETVGRCLKPGDIVIYESTVYPGCTEENCVSVLEKISGLKYNKNFWVGYSPERINPGDKKHRLTNVVKITSGSTPEAAGFIDNLYKSIVKAGTFKASSIKVAEAAKVIENTQRDINIALINELAIIFNRVGISTKEVLDAAGSKWNFLPFRPGLVGGHCIGVDPYYLTHKAQELGYHPEIILAGRRLNDNMGKYVADNVVKLMLKKKKHVFESKILILGLTFKENCADIRNTRVIDIISELNGYGADIDVHDPWVNPEEAFEEYGVSLCIAPEKKTYDAVILAVSHEQFINAGIESIQEYCKGRPLVYDVKGVFPINAVAGQL